MAKRGNFPIRGEDDRRRLYNDCSFPILISQYHSSLSDKEPRNAKELESFLRWLVNLSFENLAEERPPVSEAAAASSIEPTDYLSIIHQLSNAHDFYVTVDSRSRRSFKLDAVMTEMGSCSTFNSRALSAMSWKYVLSGDTEPDQPVLKTSYAEGDVAVHLMSGHNGTSALDIYFHSPLGIPAPASHPVTVNGHQATTLQLMSIDIVTHVKVKRVIQRHRKCLFFYEGQLPHSPHIYSHELCLRECRIDRSKSHCGCLPHFYRLEGSPGERYCRPEEISCIAHHLGSIAGRHSDCHCYASCDETTFHLVAVTRRRTQSSAETRGKLRFEIVPSKMRYRRDAQNRSYEVAVSFGGCSSLFLGLSSISIMECIFFYTCHMLRKYKLYKRN